jgi:hypothetical protein
MGVSANSDEHRGRCGGGVPGTAVFGTKGGLTGILASSLNRESVAKALRAKHTFATTGTRMAGIVTTSTGHRQGDEVQIPASEKLSLDHHFLGNAGFSSIEAFDATGCIWSRHLWQESAQPATVVRVSWGGARLYDRYREAAWNGAIQVSQNAPINATKAFGGLTYNPEDQISQDGGHVIKFASRTSGDIDGVHITFNNEPPESITISGTLGGYVKVGDPLRGHPHKPQPSFSLEARRDEVARPGGKRIDIVGGAELFVCVEAIPDEKLPKELTGTVEVLGTPGEEKAIYFVGREWSGDKCVTSPVFATFT